MGFCVAKTVKNCDKGCVAPSMVIWRSSMASSTAACVRGGLRLAWAARSRSVKSGPRCSAKLLVERLSTLLPMMSAGIRSEVHCTRRNSRSNSRAKLLMTSVLAIPGTPSSRAWPPHKTVSRHWLIISSWPTITLASSVRPCVSTWDTVCMKVGLLSLRRNQFQILRVTVQLLYQFQGISFCQLWIMQGAFNLPQQHFKRVVFVAQMVPHGAGQIRCGDIGVDAQLPSGQSAEPGVRNRQRGVDGIRAAVQFPQRVNELQRRKSRLLRQWMDGPIASRESKNESKKNQHALPEAVFKWRLAHVATERTSVVEIFVPKHVDFAGLAQRVQQQRQVAGLGDGGVGQRRVCSPPDHLAPADFVGNYNRASVVSVMSQRSGRWAFPISGRRHLNRTAARQRRKQ